MTLPGEIIRERIGRRKKRTQEGGGRREEGGGRREEGGRRGMREEGLTWRRNRGRSGHDY
jgi:hypothetical protein